MTETALFAMLAGLFGLLIGSFLNVCIYRWARTPWDLVIGHLSRNLSAETLEKWILPARIGDIRRKIMTVMVPDALAVAFLEKEHGVRITEAARALRIGIEGVSFIVDDSRPGTEGKYGLSVVAPRSACPACNSPIAWHDNVPVLSYLLLRGRCRACGASISWTYPVVELLTALFFALFVTLHGLSLAAAKDCLFASTMIGLIFSDLDTRLLPDEFTVGGLFAGLVLAVFVPLPPSVFGLIADLAGLHPGLRVISAGEAVLGAFLPAGAMWLLGWIFEKIGHKEYLGFGDVKMIAMMGAFLGISGVIVTLLLGSLLGSVGGLAYLKLTGKDPKTYYLPFATFLGGAALIVLAANGGITGWYEHLLR